MSNLHRWQEFHRGPQQDAPQAQLTLQERFAQLCKEGRVSKGVTIEAALAALKTYEETKRMHAGFTYEVIMGVKKMRAELEQVLAGRVTHANGAETAAKPVEQVAQVAAKTAESTPEKPAAPLPQALRPAAIVPAHAPAPTMPKTAQQSEAPGAPHMLEEIKGPWDGKAEQWLLSLPPAELLRFYYWELERFREAIAIVFDAEQRTERLHEVLETKLLALEEANATQEDTINRLTHELAVLRGGVVSGQEVAVGGNGAQQTPPPSAPVASHPTSVETKQTDGNGKKSYIVPIKPPARPLPSAPLADYRRTAGRPEQTTEAIDTKAIEEAIGLFLFNHKELDASKLMNRKRFWRIDMLMLDRFPYRIKQLYIQLYRSLAAIPGGQEYFCKTYKIPQEVFQSWMLDANRPLKSLQADTTQTFSTRTQTAPSTSAEMLSRPTVAVSPVAPLPENPDTSGRGAPLPVEIVAAAEHIVVQPESVENGTPSSEGVASVDRPSEPTSDELINVFSLPPVVKGRRREFSDETKQQVLRIVEKLQAEGKPVIPFLKQHGLQVLYYTWRKHQEVAETVGAENL